MSDITKCNGDGCLIKDHCKRFTAIENKFYQSYFVDPPFELEEGKFDCKMFWGDTQDAIFNLLLDITKNNS
jgi:hypothetical protein